MAGWESDPIQGRGRRGAAVFKGTYRVHQKGLQNQFSKGCFADQSPKRAWLILNVKFEVFSFSVNGCFKKVIAYIYLQNGLPRPTFFFFSKRELVFILCFTWNMKRPDQEPH